MKRPLVSFILGLVIVLAVGSILGLAVLRMGVASWWRASFMATHAPSVVEATPAFPCCNPSPTLAPPPTATPRFCLIGPANADVLYAIAGPECTSWLYQTVAGLGQLVPRQGTWNPINDTFTLPPGPADSSGIVPPNVVLTDHCAFTANSNGTRLAVYDVDGGLIGANLCTGYASDTAHWTPTGVVGWY